MGGVFANGLEISGKAVSAKTIAAFPDVCMTPPENPATPPGVPVPYPSFGMAGDTEKGTETVKIGGETVNIKNKSDESKTSGTEAGCAAKKGVVSSKNTGKAYFNSWSPDVKFDAEPVIRMSDLSTHNHASPGPNVAPWVHIAGVNPATGVDECAAENLAAGKACAKYNSLEEACAAEGMEKKPGVSNIDKTSDATLVFSGGKATLKKGHVAGSALSSNQSRILEMRQKHYGKAQKNDCLAAYRCKLMPKKDADNGGCCGMQTGHHLVPDSSFKTKSTGGHPLADCKEYDAAEAPCMCVEGSSSTKGSHGLMHNDMKCAIIDKTTNKTTGAAITKSLKLHDGRRKPITARSMTYSEMRDQALASVKKIFPESGCSDACLKQQLDNYHNQAGVSDNTDLRADTKSGRSQEEAKRTMDHLAEIRTFAKS